MADTSIASILSQSKDPSLSRAQDAVMKEAVLSSAFSTNQSTTGDNTVPNISLPTYRQLPVPPSYNRPNGVQAAEAERALYRTSAGSPVDIASRLMQWKMAEERKSAPNLSQRKTTLNLPRSESSNSTPKKAPARKGVDVWTRLYQSEAQSRSKNLVVSLEQEREKFQMLEDEYKRFSREAQRERERLAQEIRLLQEDASTDIVSLQKALMLKQDEYLEACRRLEEEKLQHDEDVTLLRNDKEKMGQELVRLKHALSEADATMKEQKQFVAKVLMEKKKAHDQASHQLGEMKKIQANVKERETNWLNEKEVRMQQDVHILQLEHTLAQREDEIKSFRSQLLKKSDEIEELKRLQITIDELKEQVRQYEDREKKLAETAVQQANKERQLTQNFHELERQQRKHAEEIQRLVQLDSQKVAELEQQKQTNKNMTLEIQQWVDKHHQKSRQAEDFQMTIDKLNNETNALQKQIQLLKHDLSLSEAQIHSKDDDLKHYKELYVDMQNRLKGELASKQEEINRLRLNVEKHQDQLNYSHSIVGKLQSHLGSAEETEQSLKRSLRARTDEVDAAQKKIAELEHILHEEVNHGKQLHEQIQMELRDREHLVHGNNSKLRMVQDKLEALQSTLNDTQDQLREYQDAEVHVRAALRQKEDLIRRHGEEIAELQQQSSALASENEELRQHKKEEMMKFQEKFQEARDSMEHEMNVLKDDLQQKMQQIHHLKDQLQQAQIQISDLSTEKVRLESNVGERAVFDDHLQRQILSLQSLAQEKEHEISLLRIKLQNANDYSKRLESEVDTFKSVNSNKDTDVSKLTYNVSGLTKRLKEQVQMLVEKDALRSTQNLALRSVSTSPVGTAFATSNSPLYSAPPPVLSSTASPAYLPKRPSKPYADILSNAQSYGGSSPTLTGPRKSRPTTANNGETLRRPSSPSGYKASIELGRNTSRHNF